VTLTVLRVIEWKSASCKLSKGHHPQPPPLYDIVFDHTACGAFAPDDDVSGDRLPTGKFVSVEGTLRKLRREGKRAAQVIEDQARLSPHWPRGEELVSCDS